MPELPEVESVVRSLRDGDPSLTGLKVKTVLVPWSGVLSDGYANTFDAEVKGSRFVDVSRHGKYLFLHLEKGDTARRYLVVHLRMTGRLHIVPESEALAQHTRFSLVLEKNLALRFDDPRKFGRVWLVNDPGEVISRLGPDALTVSYETFTSRLLNRKRQLKQLLLDQSFVAGIGNIYADEILFRAGLHPNSISSNLTPADLRLLHDSVISVLAEAVAAQGANINGVFKAGRFVVNVYGRNGKPCPRCGTPIIKIRVGQRGTHVCLQCQALK